MQPHSRFRSPLRAAGVAALATLPPLHARADHGPGTSGGAVSVQSGETLKPGAIALDLRFDYTEFEHPSRAALDARATAAGDIDALDRSLFATVGLAFGAAEDVQVGVSTGFYHAIGTRGDALDPTAGTTDVASFDPDGLTDLWVTGKTRVSRGPSGSVAVFGGAKAPVGRRVVYNSADERIEPSAAAGSGAWDEMLGTAWSKWLTERITLDVSVQFTHRGEYRDFKIGDRIDAGVAAAYRLMEDIQAYPQESVFVELTARRIGRSADDGASDENTGGTAFFLSPGARVGLSPSLSASLSLQLPVAQDLNGEQLETRYKLVAGLTVIF